MALPIRVAVEDIIAVCSYLATKPTGATLKETKAVVDKKHLDSRKLAAMKTWGLLDEADGKYKVTEHARKFLRNEEGRVNVLSDIIRTTAPYLAIIERVAHKHEDALTITEVASHWYDHFESEVGGMDSSLREQALVFFQVASGASLGTLIMGRKGQPTRFSFKSDAVAAFASINTIQDTAPVEAAEGEAPLSGAIGELEPSTSESARPADAPTLGQAIFIAHGKNKKVLDQLKKILDQFRIPYRVAVDEPNLGRPISAKVRDIMKSCNCAVLIFSADEEFRDREGNTIWRPSENVIYELGATAFLYDNRIVVMKEEGVSFPTNFRDIGNISFDKDQLDAKALDILKELIGFGIVRVST